MAVAKSFVSASRCSTCLCVSSSLTASLGTNVRLPRQYMVTRFPVDVVTVMTILGNVNVDFCDTVGCLFAFWVTPRIINMRKRICCDGVSVFRSLNVKTALTDR